MTAQRAYRARRAALALVLALLAGLPAVTPAAPAAQAEAVADFVLDDFEATLWSGMTAATDPVREGAQSGRWAFPTTPVTRDLAGAAADWSAYRALEFWLYSEQAVWNANGTGALQLVIGSENPASEGIDYYYHTIPLDWVGWRHFRLPLADLGAAREPLGWHALDRVRLHASGWGHTPAPGMVVYVDDVRLTARAAVIDGPFEARSALAGAAVQWPVTVRNEGPDDATWTLTASGRGGPTVAPATATLAAGASIHATVTATAPAAGPGERFHVDVHVADAEGNVATRTLDGRVAAEPQATRPHPAVFVDAAALQAAYDKATREPWAADALATLRAGADALAAEAPTVPLTPGQWTQFFVCADGTRLVYDRASPTRHYCPSTGQFIEGDARLDAAWVGFRHNELARETWDAAVAFGITGEAAYAEAAERVLLGYADQYRNWPYRDRDDRDTSGAGRAMSSTLAEASWLLPLAGAYDILRDRLTAAERVNIESNLLEPATHTIRRNPSSTLSNWNTWHNAAVAAVGFAMDRDDLVAHALDGPAGVRYQLANAVLSDGFWWETAPAYHYYALRPLVWTALAASNAGIDLFTGTGASAGIIDMFRAPLLLSNHDLVIPALDDSVTAFPVTAYADLYEVAHAVFDDAATEFVLATAYGDHGRTRDGLFALLFGDALEGAGTDPRRSVDLNASGRAVLRTPDHFVVLDYGPHGGFHGHDDKLGVVFASTRFSFAGGFALNDPGRASYHLPLHQEYLRRTVAHNTVVVDGLTQTASTGTLEAFNVEGDARIARATANDAYAGVELTRTLVLTDDYLLDIVDAADRERATRVFDHVLHGPALPVTATVETAPTTLTGDGYQYLMNPRSGNVTAPFRVEWRSAFGGAGVTAWGVPDPAQATQVVLADAPNNPATSTHPVLVQRVEADKARFVTVVEAHAGVTRVLSAAVLADAVIVALQNGGFDVFHVDTLTFQRLPPGTPLPDTNAAAASTL